ncbi:NERD domain-containing protein [Candidatus Saccharibacteria bacterium]|nr:NERD domain-containing protein [Candidatus Saccharibacteria bacterium]
MLDWIVENWWRVVIVFLVSWWVVKNYNKIDRLFHRKEWANKGSAGERALYNFLTEELHYPKSMIYRNLLIKDDDGNRAEIDLVLLHAHGVVVFEMKNFSGEVFGDEKSKSWKSRIGKKTYEFYNPIMQNKRHIEVLRKRLGNDKLKFYSIVVFGDKATIRNLSYKARNTWVGKMSGLKKVDKMIMHGCKMGVERSSEESRRIRGFLRGAERERVDVLRDREN